MKAAICFKCRETDNIKRTASRANCPISPASYKYGIRRLNTKNCSHSSSKVKKNNNKVASSAILVQIFKKKLKKNLEKRTYPQQIEKPKKLENFMLDKKTKKYVDKKAKFLNLKHYLLEDNYDVDRAPTCFL